jgi:maltooligosyltrehalose trehalohydrolase
MDDPFPFWYPVGGQTSERGAAFRVWAPNARSVGVTINGQFHPLQDDGHAYFEGRIDSAGPGTRYRYQINDQPPVADPASRFQPDGPHGPSALIDPNQFRWTDHEWPGISMKGQVIYEMHIGTFTLEGTWAAAQEQLPALAELGVTVLEIMPIAEFPGRFGWGYDGVNLYAPTRLYGSPDDFRRFVDRAHALKLAVILDVVYNHLGPDGNFLPMFSKSYFSKAHSTDWGEAINFDCEGSEGVREYYAANAAYWIKEYHLDGLRLDATQNIYDETNDHILALVARTARKAAGNRSIIITAENESQDIRLVSGAKRGGYGLDGIWNEDFHHSVAVAATGKKEAYYTDYNGTAQELISLVKHGFLYQGQHYSWQKKRRGTPTYGVPSENIVAFIQNHDQVANSACGLRIHEITTPGRYRAITSLLLLAPQTPLLFQGQEFASSAPFLFFANHRQDLASLVREGRREFLQQWSTIARGEIALADPGSPATFELCKLDHTEREKHAEAFRLHRDLLSLRRSDAAFSSQSGNVDGAVLAPEALVIRFFGDTDNLDRLLLVNLGRDLHYSPAPEPLLAPPPETQWEILWSSEDPAYGGAGTTPPEGQDGWNLPGHAAIVLQPARAVRQQI